MYFVIKQGAKKNFFTLQIAKQLKCLLLKWKNNSLYVYIKFLVVA